LCVIYIKLKVKQTPEMTSVLYGAGLNYQLGNPVRQEIVTVRRDVDSLRKQIDVLTEENLLYRKHIMKLLQNTEGGTTEFTRDVTALENVANGNSSREPGGATVQGAGFRR